MSGRLTVVILTLNEARHLPRCLDHVPEGYPIVVVDSGSTDGTLDIARARGARVFVNPWPGFAAQRNFALEACGIDTEWTLFIDADELFPSAFYEWFERWAAAPESAGCDAGMVASILVFKGVRLRHAPGYPIYHPRLARTAKARFFVNHTRFGESVAEGTPVIHIDIPYDHHFYDGDLVSWMHKHVHWASLEANPVWNAGAAITVRSRVSVALGRTWLRIPLRFIYHYFLKQGFRDGRAGFEYALIYTWFEATKYVVDRAGDLRAYPPRQ
ncbi:MAG: glycosyltransferase family 2 protein [Alphaproteobacteria bacterium]|nr:glycosyltransferase family 2 protein [Alphaproteobacteria bacterium]